MQNKLFHKNDVLFNYPVSDLATDLFSELDGPRKLLFCLAIVTVGVLVCCAICSVFYFLMPDCLKTKKSTSKPSFANAAESLIQRPPIPNFAPPSQGIPNVIITDYSKIPVNM